MKQAADVLRLEKETAEKLAAKAFAKSYLADLVPSVFNNLRENGYFYDPVERDIETGFMPWIMAETVAELDKQALARLMLDSLIRDVVAKRHAEYEKMSEYLNEQKLNESNLENLEATEATTLNENNQDAEENQNENDNAADADAKQSNLQEEV